MAIASLQTTLAPLSFFLQSKHIYEIMINRPNEIWLDDGKTIVKQGIDLSYKMLKRLADLIAAQSGQEISEQKPLLSATLPGGHRVQVILSPVVKFLDEDKSWQDTVCLGIRKQADIDFDLKFFENQGGFSHLEHKNSAPEKELNYLYLNKNYCEFLTRAVQLKKTILISGGTYSGKTTLLNMLIKHMDNNERILSLEDTPELHIPHGNQVRLFYSRGMQSQAKMSAHDLLNASLRMRPDRIIMGELREDDAVCWLQAANTGHEGTLSTIHSDSPTLAIQKLTDMVRVKYPRQSDESIKQYIHAVVDIIVQIKRNTTTGQRYISEILFLEGSSCN
ncbi:MAG: P-type DNA transfer ATPase VirB11 [Legionellales bacterium]|jgi:type IV secretion system protein VirB11